MARPHPYDRASEDVGNIVALEHVNLLVPDQLVATSFYVSALGLTRDPYMMTGTDVMWINVGRNQFHLPTRGTQVLRGHIAIVVRHFDRLADRLKAARPLLQGTRFAWRRRDDRIDATCPWGNRYRCYPPGGRFADMELGIPYVCFDVPRGTADGIVRFYDRILGAPSRLERFENAPAAIVSAGPGQELIFRETRDARADYDGHHIQIYVADFAGPHAQLLERGLVTEESDAHQYRFEAIVDPDDGTPLFEVEHEVRSLRHPLYDRPLVNRNPDQMVMSYTRGDDAIQVG
jgi:hypothetical protein